MKSTKIILAGEGGQGIQTIAKVLSEAAFREKHFVSYIPSFGVEQRGTPSIAYLTIGKEEIRYPRFEKANYVVVLQTRAVEAIAKFVDCETTIIFDSSTIPVKMLPKNAAAVLGIPATKIATEEFMPKVFNVIIAGKVSKILGLAEESVFQAIGDTLGKKFKDEKIKKANYEAFKYGRELIAEIDKFTKPAFMPAKESIVCKGYDKTAEILPAKCKGCGICIEKCPVKALSRSEVLGVFATPVPQVDLEKCIACGNCYRFCPDAAIDVKKE